MPNINQNLDRPTPGYFADIMRIVWTCWHRMTCSPPVAPRPLRRRRPWKKCAHEYGPFENWGPDGVETCEETFTRVFDSQVVDDA